MYGRISNKQKEILEYLKSQIINKGYPPSVREYVSCKIKINLIGSLSFGDS